MAAGRVDSSLRYAREAAWRRADGADRRLPLLRLRTVSRRFLSLGELPPSDGLLAATTWTSAEPRYPLDVAFCQDCALVQILKTVPPEELFGDDYPYFSSFTDAIVRHAEANVARADRRAPARACKASSSSWRAMTAICCTTTRPPGSACWASIPRPGRSAAARDKGIETLQAFFGLELAAQLAAGGRRADVIHANNVLAHVADTNGFVAGIAALLKDDGRRGDRGALCPRPDRPRRVRHDLSRASLLFLGRGAGRLFRRHGLLLNRVERVAIHGGSLRLFVERRERPRGLGRSC